jgi:ubiquinone/menaquinone biosynthesis C-methylase UbiE
LVDHAFSSAVPYYVRYRPGYPPSLIAKLARKCALDGTGRLLDLGCGPGYLAIPLSAHFAEVVAMDPEPAMLEAARDGAARAGARVSFIEGSSRDLGPHLGSFRMVTIGRALAWMERDETMARLDALIAPGGRLVVIEDRHAKVPENDWVPVFRKVQARWGERSSRADNWEPAIKVVERSRFRDMRLLEVRYARSLTLDDVVGWAYSMSTSSPAVLGEKRDDFERDLRDSLLALDPSGRFRQVIAVHAIMARRPAAA